MSLYTETLRNGWTLNGSYINQLVGDLTQDQMTVQPAEGFNHPAWLLAHLRTYHPVIEALLRGREPDDPADAPFGMKSSPQTDPAVYERRDALVDGYNEGHRRVLAALDGASEEVLGRPMPVRRWADRGFPQMGSILGYLMVRHEALHAGQLSAWRRAMGLPRVG